MTEPDLPEALPIRQCCPSKSLAVLLVLVAASAAAGANGIRPVTLNVPYDAGDVLPGGSLVVQVVAENAGLPVEAEFILVDWPAGWGHSFAPARVTLAQDGSAISNLTLFAPSGASPGTNASFLVEVRGTTTGAALSEAAPLVVDVVAPPTAPAPAPDLPRLDIKVASASGAPGEMVTGLVRLSSADVRRLDVRVEHELPSAWRARVDSAFQAMYEGDIRTVPITAVIPVGSRNNTVHTFDALARVDSYVFRAPWTITVVWPDATATEPPVTDPTPPPNGEAGTDAQSPDGGATDAPAPGSTPVDASIAILSSGVEVAPGGSARALIRLENKGTEPLALTLTGDAADGWPFFLDAEHVTLAPGETRHVGFVLAAPADVFPGGTGRGVVTARADDGRVFTAPFDVRTVPAPVANARESEPPGATDAPLAAPPIAWGLAAGLGAVGAGALVLTHRPSREKFLWLGIGLYTRLMRPDVLGHDARERLHEVVAAQPGIHFHALMRELSWNTGTLTYHLRVLERHNFLVSRRDGLLRRFYVSGAAPRQDTFNQGPSGLRADVLEAIRSRNGISQTDLSLAMGANKQTVNYHVKALERQGDIRIEKRGRDTYLFVQDATRVTADEAHA